MLQICQLKLRNVCRLLYGQWALKKHKAFHVLGIKQIQCGNLFLKNITNFNINYIFTKNRNNNFTSQEYSDNQDKIPCSQFFVTKILHALA